MKNKSTLLSLLAAIFAISISSCVSTPYIKEIDVAVRADDYLAAYKVYKDNQEDMDANYDAYARALSCRCRRLDRILRCAQ